jgi:hypothetical protein
VLVQSVRGGRYHRGASIRNSRAAAEAKRPRRGVITRAR